MPLVFHTEELSHCFVFPTLVRLILHFLLAALQRAPWKSVEARAKKSEELHVVKNKLDWGLEILLYLHLDGFTNCQLF